MHCASELGGGVVACEFDEVESMKRSKCPVSCTLDLIGDKWTLLVVRDLMLGKKYFKEFLDSPESIATNILSARLDWLQEKKLIAKKPDSSDKRKSVYQLTAKGRKLRPLLEYIAVWGLENLPGTDVPPGVSDRLRG